MQIAVKEGRRDKVIEHLGSAHTQAELAALMEIGRRRIAPDQLALDLPPTPPAPQPASSGPANVGAVVASKRSALLWDVLHGAYTRLGLGEAVGGDRAFEQMVLARLIEPTSKAQVPCVLADLGLESVSVRTLLRSLGRCIERDYRQAISAAALKHAMAAGDVSLCLYDVTTLYFETEKEDELRKVGYSKERRVDPQIIVGLLVDRAGFPLRIGCWEGNRAETTTIVGVVEQFRQAAKVEPLVVVADAGMLSAANLNALDEAGVGFIVGSRTTRAPGDLEAHFHWHGDAPADGQVTRHHHPQKRLEHRAGQEPQGRACLGPAHPSRLVEGHLGLLIQALHPGQPHTGRPGEQGQGRHCRRQAPQVHTFCHHPQRRPGPR